MDGVLTIIILALAFGINLSLMFLLLTIITNKKEKKHFKNEQNEKIHHNTKT